MSDTVSHRQRVPLERQPGCPFDPPLELSEMQRVGSPCPAAMADGSDGWILTRHEDVRNMLKDHTLFSSRGELRTSATGHQISDRKPARPGQLNAMDPPDHTRLRRKVGGKFSTRRMAQLTGHITKIVNDRLDDMERLGPPLDLHQVFALPIPVLVICELLGVPFEERERFQSLTGDIVRVDATPEEFAAAQGGVAEFVGALAAQKRVHPADDFLSELAAEEDLSLEEVATLGRALLVAGHETTSSMLAVGTFALLQHPEQLELVRSRPELIDNAIEELLRYLTIAQYGLERAATEDTEIGGRQIKKGDIVVGALMAANRDPEKFPDPDTLDITRSTSGHLAFGFGAHQCVGQQLARVEMRVAFTALINRFPSLRLAAPAEEIELRYKSVTIGPKLLPVTWDVETPEAQAGE